MPPASVRLMSQYPGTLIVEGPTGKEYKFVGGGSVIEVDSQDAEKFLQMVFSGNSCCGSAVRNVPKFIVVE